MRERPKPELHYSDEDIRDEFLKVSWYGVNPYMSIRAVELGKFMHPPKFESIRQYVAAIANYVEKEFADRETKPNTPAAPGS